MKDYLREMCISLGIKLIYTNNKVIALSAQVKNNIPVLRAHKVFKHCPHMIAQEVIAYYIDSENRNKHEKVLQEYLNENFSSDIFKLKTFSKDFKKEIVKSLPPSSNINDNSLVEFDIDSITVKDAWGKEEKCDINKPITLPSDDILELNVVIKPPVT